MHKEKISWWWFLLCAGFVIPVISSILFNTQPSYIYISKYFVTGLNPLAIYIPNFLIVLMICIYYKVIKPKSLLYIASGIIILILINVVFFVKDEGYVINSFTRRYQDNAKIISNLSNSWTKLFPNILISLSLLFFLIINYSKKTK